MWLTITWDLLLTLFNALEGGLFVWEHEQTRQAYFVAPTRPSIERIMNHESFTVDIY